MRKKIRIKVKYFIIVPIFIFVIFPNCLYGIAKAMYSMDFYLSEDSEITTRQYSYGIFKLYSNLPKVSPFKGDAYFYLGKLTYDYSVKACINGRRGSILSYRNMDLGSYEEAVKYHTLGIENSDGTDFSLNTTALFNLYLEKQERGLAEDIMNKSLKEKNWKKNMAGKVLKIQLAIIDNDYKEIEKGYEEIKKITHSDFLYNKILKEEEFYFEKTALGEKNYIFNEKKLATELINTMEFYKLQKEYVTVEDKDGNISYDYKDNNITVKGKITVEGEPLRYIPVAAGNILFNGYIYRSDIMQSTGKISYTDREGNYEVKGLLDPLGVAPIIPKYLIENYTVEEKVIENPKKDGEYIVNLDLKKRMNINIKEEMDLEGDLLEFTFDKVEEADYYKVGLEFIEEVYGVTAYIRSEDNKITVPILEGSLMGIEGRRNLEVDGELINEPSNVRRYKKDTIDRITVEAIKKVGDKEIIINSNSKETKIKSKAKALNEGEKLIEAGEIDKGVAWLEDKIKKEGYKKEYIYPLLIVTSRVENHKEYLEMEENREKRKEIFSEKRLEETKKAEEVLLKELYKINKNEDEIGYFKDRYSELYMRYGIIS